VPLSHRSYSQAWEIGHTIWRKARRAAAGKKRIGDHDARIAKGGIAATEIRSDHPNRGMSKSIPREDSFLVGLQLRGYPRREYWEDGQPAPICDLHAGETCFHDLKRDPIVLLDKPFHSVNFYLPRATFNAIADEVDAPPIGDLHYKPGSRSPRLANVCRKVCTVTLRRSAQSLELRLGKFSPWWLRRPRAPPVIRRFSDLRMLNSAWNGRPCDFGLWGIRGPVAPSSRPEAKPHPRPKATAISARFTR
jgi:hypothetical protein